MSVVGFFFFFQAEDGIRDADVTGVQTCALPISGLRNENGLGQKLPQDVAAAGADRFADADFLSAFGHTDQHDVHDPDSSRDERDETYYERAHSHVSRDVNECALERIVAVNLEIVRLIRTQAARNTHRSDSAVERPIVSVLCERLRRDVDCALRFPVILEEPRDRHDAQVVLALSERRPFLREHANNRVRVAADTNDFADRRFVRKQPLLDHFSNNDHAPRKIDVFIIQIAAVTERGSVRGKKTPIGSDNEQARSGLDAIVDGLAFYFVTKTLEANFSRLAFHQSIIMQRLLISDVVSIPKFFLHIAACANTGRIFRELKNVRAEKAQPVLN